MVKIKFAIKRGSLLVLRLGIKKLIYVKRVFFYFFMIDVMLVNYSVKLL